MNDAFADIDRRDGDRMLKSKIDRALMLPKQADAATARLQRNFVIELAEYSTQDFLLFAIQYRAENFVSSSRSLPSRIHSR